MNKILFSTNSVINAFQKPAKSMSIYIYIFKRMWVYMFGVARIHLVWLEQVESNTVHTNRKEIAF